MPKIQPVVTRLLLLFLLLFLTFSALVASPKKTTLHGGQSRSSSAEQGKKKKKKSLAVPPPPARAARSEKINKNKQEITRSIHMSRHYASRRHAGGLGPSRVRTRIPTTRRLGQWVSLREVEKHRSEGKNVRRTLHTKRKQKWYKKILGKSDISKKRKRNTCGYRGACISKDN